MSWTDAFIKRQVGKAADYKRSRTEIEVMDDGVYRSYSNGVTVLTQKEMSFPETAKLNAGKGKEGVQMLVPKIPAKYWLMTLDFYKDIFTKFRTEASVLFYWNLYDKEIPEDLYNEHKDGLIIDGKLVVYCPKQYNTGIRSTFKEDKLMDWFEKNYQCIVETHSHHRMEAFFSGVDNANEMQPRCYGVFGRIITQDDFLLRFCLNGVHALIEPTDVFEIPKRVKRFKRTVVESRVDTVYVDEDGNEVVHGGESTTNTSDGVAEWVYVNNHTYPESWLNMNLSGRDDSPIYDSEDEAHSYHEGAVTLFEVEDCMPDDEEEVEGSDEFLDSLTLEERQERSNYRRELSDKLIDMGLAGSELHAEFRKAMDDYDSDLMFKKGRELGEDAALAVCPAKEEDEEKSGGYTCHDDVKLR